MNAGHLRAKIRKLNEEHEEESIESGELNLVPYLDIVTNVIMFLMMSNMALSAALANIDVTAPSRAQGGGGDNPAPQNDLNLTVNISDKGFTIACAGGVLFEGCKILPHGEFECPPGNKVPTLPRLASGYDYAGLTKKMREIKKIASAGQDNKVIINANPEIIYQILVDTMDAIRGNTVVSENPNDPAKKTYAYELFGNVLLAASVN